LLWQDLRATGDERREFVGRDLTDVIAVMPGPVALDHGVGPDVDIGVGWKGVEVSGVPAGLDSRNGSASGVTVAGDVLLADG
jgi:hypothetical protein